MVAPVKYLTLFKAWKAVIRKQSEDFTFIMFSPKFQYKMSMLVSVEKC